MTYKELAVYVDVLNAVKEHLDTVDYAMHGAFPDNDQTADLDMALRQAELLVSNAEALRNEIRALRAQWASEDDQ